MSFMKGIWTGKYKHENKRIPEERRNQWTKFKIEITKFDGKNFSGEIEDDLDSGGTRGKGIIEGKLNNNKIEFVKKMPIQTILLPDGTRNESIRPQRNIYYSGLLEDGFFKGSWKFKWGIRRVNNKVALLLPIKGIWEMRKVNKIAILKQ